LSEAEQQTALQVETSEQTVIARLSALEQSVNQRVKQAEETAAQQLDQLLTASLVAHHEDLQQKLEQQFLNFHKGLRKLKRIFS
jgi:hypothetical protein